MTNEQLAVLLRNYRDSIEVILKDIGNSLPDDLFVETRNFCGITGRKAPILDDLNMFYRKICDDVEYLRGSEHNEK
jgi:hypothetical protein